MRDSNRKKISSSITYERLKFLRNYETFGQWLEYRWAVMRADHKVLYRIKMERERELRWFRNRWQNQRADRWRKLKGQIDLKFTKTERL